MSQNFRVEKHQKADWDQIGVDKDANDKHSDILRRREVVEGAGCEVALRDVAIPDLKCGQQVERHRPDPNQ